MVTKVELIGTGSAKVSRNEMKVKNTRASTSVDVAGRTPIMSTKGSSDIEDIRMQAN